eukprot:Hpha_TRINITY_DN13867_c0_g1::TRINITY_DN13867_c0_g1_i2::g.69592::m.69592
MEAMCYMAEAGCGKNDLMQVRATATATPLPPDSTPESSYLAAVLAGNAAGLDGEPECLSDGVSAAEAEAAAEAAEAESRRARAQELRVALFGGSYLHSRRGRARAAPRSYSPETLPRYMMGVGNHPGVGEVQRASPPKQYEPDRPKEFELPSTVAKRRRELRALRTRRLQQLDASTTATGSPLPSLPRPRDCAIDSRPPRQLRDALSLGAGGQMMDADAQDTARSTVTSLRRTNALSPRWQDPASPQHSRLGNMSSSHRTATTITCREGVQTVRKMAARKAMDRLLARPPPFGGAGLPPLKYDYSSGRASDGDDEMGAFGVV